MVLHWLELKSINICLRHQRSSLSSFRFGLQSDFCKFSGLLYSNLCSIYFNLLPKASPIWFDLGAHVYLNIKFIF